MSSEPLRKQDWTVIGLHSTSEAVAFLERHHYAKGAGKASLYRHGLYRRDETIWPLVGELMGVALWQPPLLGVSSTVAREGEVLVLSRLCVHPDVPQNGASFLLGASMRLIDRRRWPTLLTYADTALGHTGAIYKATNWRLVGMTDLERTWIDADGVQRGTKRGDRFLTVEEMHQAGFTQKAKAPKLKFVHGPFNPTPFNMPRRHQDTQPSLFETHVTDREAS